MGSKGETSGLCPALTGCCLEAALGLCPWGCKVRGQDLTAGALCTPLRPACPEHLMTAPFLFSSHLSSPVRPGQLDLPGPRPGVNWPRPRDHPHGSSQ